MFNDHKFNSYVLGYIKQILRENSGGVKMTSLITSLISKIIENDLVVGEFKFANFVSGLDNYLKGLESEGIYVLTYDHDMGEVIREKQFVYTKVKPK